MHSCVPWLPVRKRDLFYGMASARFMVSGNPFLVRAKQNIFNIRQLLIFIYENFF